MRIVAAVDRPEGLVIYDRAVKASYKNRNGSSSGLVIISLFALLAGAVLLYKIAPLALVAWVALSVFTAMQRRAERRRHRGDGDSADPNQFQYAVAVLTEDGIAFSHRGGSSRRSSSVYLQWETVPYSDLRGVWYRDDVDGGRLHFENPLKTIYVERLTTGRNARELAKAIFEHINPTTAERALEQADALAALNEQKASPRPLEIRYRSDLASDHAAGQRFGSPAISLHHYGIRPFLDMPPIGERPKPDELALAVHERGIGTEQQKLVTWFFVRDAFVAPAADGQHTVVVISIDPGVRAIGEHEPAFDVRDVSGTASAGEIVATIKAYIADPSSRKRSWPF